MNNTQFVEVDILIIGAGMAGCISAMSLHRDFNIVLVEKATDNDCYLTETLIASSKRIFKELKLQDWLLTEHCRKTYTPCDGSVSYWGGDAPVYTDALRNPEGENWILNKKHFTDELRNRTQQFSFPLLRGTVHTLCYEDGYWNIEMKVKDGVRQWYRAKFVIDASGRSAVAARKVGVKRVIEDKLICISAVINNPTGNLLCTTFSDKNGWWFVCPLNSNDMQLSYYTDADLTGKKLTGKAEQFKAFVDTNTEFRKRFGGAHLNRFQFLGTSAANTSRLERFCAKGWCAIGDAAMCFDPLSSQGSFKAMATAMQLTALLRNYNFITTESKTHEALFQELFREQMEKIWTHYKSHHAHYYQMEEHRTDVFWKRRNFG